MSEEEKIMLETNQSITKMETCFRNKIKELQQENKELHNKIHKVIDLLQQYLPNYTSCVKLLDELEEILKDGGVDVKDKR